MVFNCFFCFFDNTKYLEQFLHCLASVCIAHPNFVERAPKNMVLLTTVEPYTAYAKAAQMFYRSKDEVEGISDKADIHPTAKIGENCSIGAFTSIGENVVIGEGSVIGRNVSIRSTQMGKHCVVHDGARIGQEGFGFAMGAEHIKVPQLGGVIIGDYVEIGANTCIDRGAGPNTTIGSGTKIDNMVQIAHNVEIGKNCVITAQCGIAGSTKLGDYVVLGGQSGIAGHLNIGTAAKIAANAGVMKDIPAHGVVGGIPAINIRDWHKGTLLMEKMINTKKVKGENENN
jgi:UDP-3-O-[3-hydroxymyristoyl] glucosamine N-acyltransferase